MDSVKVVTDDGGLPVTHIEHLPYGEVLAEEGNECNRPKFNSQALDKESGFYFFNARHYDAEIARFVTADSVVDGEYSVAGWNRYMYCAGNPVLYKDPSGHNMALDWLNDKISERIDYHVESVQENWSKGNYFQAAGNVINITSLGVANAVIPTSEQAEIAACTFGIGYAPVKASSALAVGKKLTTKLTKLKYVNKAIKFVASKKSTIARSVKNKSAKIINWIKGKPGVKPEKIKGAGFFERMFKRKAKIDTLKPNPKDPFNTIPLDKAISSHRNYMIQNGKMKAPIEVIKKGKYYQIENGHHRWKAAQQLKWKKVPVNINKE